MNLLDVVTMLFTAYITVDMARYLRSNQLKKDFSAFRTLKKYRWVGAIFGSIALIAVTLFIGLSLFYAVPFTRWSWLMLLQTPGDPNPQPTNLMTAGFRIPWFMMIFIPLFALNIPRLAKREEEVFRHRIRSPKEAIIKSIKFGYVHCLVGVPLAIGTALIIPGLVFSYIYSKGGTRLSTAWHAVYNYLILTLAVVALVYWS